MTQETDALIAYVRATGVPAVISDINTPHVHTVTSYHYRPGTQSSHVEPLDFDQGKVGLSVDFVFQHGGKPDTPQLAAIYRAFAPVEHLLAELFHSGPTADHFIKNGKSYPIAQLDAADRAIHHNHVHAAVAKGVLLGAPLVPPPAQAPPGDDMAETFEVTNTNGPGYWIIRRKDGAVYAEAGAPFFGGMAGQPINAPIVAFAPHLANGQVDGYWLAGEDGGVFGFGAAQVPDSYAGHPEWHSGSRYVVGLRQHDPGYDLITVEPGTDPPKIDTYDLSAKR